jgi:glycerophosphoryl diester phosphodiesterase
MRLHSLIENAFLRAADVVYRRFPQPVPDDNRFKRCRLISHRGDHENSGVLENTVAAFEAAVAGGVWGIEFDVRWTQDLQPVVIHDTDTRRLFGSGIRIQHATYRALRHAHPLIPHFEEVVQAFGGRVHFMVELKEEPYPDPVNQRRRLERILSGLAPRRDFHLISLTPKLFDVFGFVPERALLPIAQVNMGAMSKLAATRGFGGLLGHYVMMTDSIVKMHRKLGQATGTGFVDSKNCLFRELNRGITWLFSNRAAAMQSIVNACLDKS